MERPSGEIAWQKEGRKGGRGGKNSEAASPSNKEGWAKNTEARLRDLNGVRL